MSKSTKTTPAKPEGVNMAAESPAAAAGTSTTAQKKPTLKSDGFSVYLGPTIPGLIQSGHIYGGSRDEALKDIAPIVEKHPLVASLLVDGDTLAVDRIKVKTPGNLLFANYEKLAAGEIS